jgi:hypothetical protein
MCKQKCANKNVQTKMCKQKCANKNVQTKMWPLNVGEIGYRRFSMTLFTLKYMTELQKEVEERLQRNGLELLAQSNEDFYSFGVNFTNV